MNLSRNAVSKKHEMKWRSIGMKTILKVLIACVLGLVVMWLCYQVFHLEQVMTTVVTIAFTVATVAVCDKIKMKPSAQK